MTDDSRTDATLPSVFARLAPSPGRRVRVLTIIYHPDRERIGQHWLLPEGTSRALVLGREQPLFGRDGAAPAKPLADPHVSRRALSLRSTPAAVVLSQLPGACRCRVQGQWLGDEQLLDAESLRRGVSLQLAHSVVLLLREQALPAEPATSGPLPADLQVAFCGSSFPMLALRRQIARLAALGMDVLIRGETGSGKELVARALHACSERAKGPLVAVNMAAIPAGVAAAALFGSVRGAFTGAERNSPGYFQQAEGGSLFLDEVGDTPDEVQPQLLRALQEREIQPVGGRVQRVDVRVISATDIELEGEHAGFRSALLYRLGSAVIRVPALREHPEDIGELLCHFLDRVCAETGREPMLPEPGADAMRVAQWAELFHLCLRHPWPGNVRELANCVRQLVLDGEGSLQPPSMLWPPRAAVEEGREAAVAPAAVELGDDALRALLAQERYEVAAAARRAAMSRAALYRRLPALGLRLAAQLPEAELRRALAEAGGDPAAAAMALRVSARALRLRLQGAQSSADGGEPA